MMDGYIKKEQTMSNNLLIENRSLNLPEPYEADYPQGVGNIDSHSSDRAHLHEFLYSLRRYKWLIAGVTLLCTAAVAVYMAGQSNLYEAAAQVQVDLETVSTNVATPKASTFVVNAVNDPAYFNTQLQVLKSPKLLRRVVETLNLEHDPDFRLPRSNAGASWWRKLPGAVSAEPSSATAQSADKADEASGNPKEDLANAARLAPYVEAIQEDLSVEPVKEIRLPIKETRLINLTYSHSEPRVAAKIVNAIADTFVLSNLERKTGNNKTVGNVLQERITELQAQIKSQEKNLLEYAKSHQILSLDPTQNTVVERLVNLNRQLLEAENERKVAAAAYQAALAPGAADALASGDAREATDAESRLAQLWQRRSQLMVDYTEAWPEVREIDNQIAVLERQLKQTRTRATAVVVTNLSTRYRQAAAREQALRTSFNKQRGETLTQNEAAVNYRIIQQEIETNRGLLEGMLQRSKENDAALAAMRSNIHVNDYAIIPQVPVGPKRMLYTSVAFALSLGLGIGLAVILGYMDNSVRSAGDLERTLHLRPLAAIPAIGKKEQRMLQAFSGRKHSSNGNGHRQLLLNGNAPTSLREAYRQLSTAMLLSKGHGKVKSLLITSSVSGEGKTTMAVNTGISLSRTGALVLLIDADLRKPRLHEIFGLKNQNGLSRILSEETDPVAALKMVKHHAKSGVDVLTSGPALPDSAEYLGSEQMRRLVATFEYTYDYIVIDSPPVTYFADGVLLSALVDGVVLVVNSGESARETVRHSYQLLQDVGANMYGVVLNNVKEFRHNYDYYDAKA